MDAADVASLAQHITTSWPNQLVEPTLVEKWVSDFKPLDFQTMVVAVDRLRLTQDVQPTTAQLMRMYTAVAREWMVPSLPPVVEQDPDRPFNTSWRLLTESWIVLRGQHNRHFQRPNPWVDHCYAVVTKEIRDLATKTRELMPSGPDAVAPLTLVALAVAARERVRTLLFGGEEASAGVQDAPKTAGRLVNESASPMPPAPPIHTPPPPIVPEQPPIPDEPPPPDPEDIFA